MSTGRLKATAVGSSLAVLLALAPQPASAEGNAGVHLLKVVDPVQLAINPNIGVTLGVDKVAAIPGDTLTYTAVVTNPTATFTMGGYIDAQAVASADAIVAYYWDELEVCSTGCGNGYPDPHWTAVAAFETGQSGYQPVTPPAVHTGMTFAAQPVNRTGVTYPTSGDPVLGTDITPKATATWTYLARVMLTPGQVATLSDPTRVTAIRNVIHFEVTVRDLTAAQPYTDPESFANPFQTMSNPGAIHDITVTFTLPDGTTAAVAPAQVAGLGLLNPGGSVSATTTYKVPVPAARGAAETERAYALRLGALDGAPLNASAVASGTGFSGTVYATSNSVTTVENVPILTIAKGGPQTVDAGTTEDNPLTLSNIGGVTASSITVVDTVPGGSGTVSGVPPTLEPGGTAAAAAHFPVPGSQPEGNLTDTASVTWKDGNGNPYGSFTSSFMTLVHNLLTGGRLTLAPANAGPNPIGTTQQLTATLVDRNGDPVGNRTITLNITGANPGTFTATTSPGGDAVFTYTGANSGSDVAQATFSASGVTLTSNTSSISWGAPLQPVAIGVVTGNFFPNPNDTCTFGADQTSRPAFNQQFPDILFNPATAMVPHNISGIDTFTRPFTDLTVDVNGNYNGQIVAQGMGQQAGNGSLTDFYAEFTGTFIANQPGDVTFAIQHDDGYIFGVGGGATRVNGDLVGNPPATPFNGYEVAASFNAGASGSSHSGTATVHFPAAGSYPFELDYTECTGGELFLVLQTAKFTGQTSPLSVYVGYADGLRPGGSIFPFPWNGSPNVIFFPGGGSDDGAIRFDNSGTDPITFDQVTVDIGPFHYDIWPRNVVLPPGKILILTGTAGDNFDTSDTPITCSPTGFVPEIHITVGGVVTTFKDTGQILNTSGIDPAQCGLGNESHAWTRIGGGGTAVNTPLPPGASLVISPFKVASAIVGQNQTLTVSAMDGAGNPVANLPVTLEVFGPNAQVLPATTLSTGLATFNYVGRQGGTDSIQASGFVGGLREISNLGSVTWTAPGGVNGPPPPTITSPSPADGTVVTKPVTVSATIAPPAGETITSWRVFYQALDPGPQVVIASGSGAPPANMATFDPTVLPNDTYAITVEATASNGGVQDVTTTVTVLGNLKPGRYTATYQDLFVAVNGMRMEVRRSYDSFEKSSGDFGVGWKVSIGNFRVAPNRQLGAGGWTMYNKQCFFGLCLTGYKNSAPRLVSVVFPDQHTELFNFTPAGGTNVFWDCTPQFTAVGEQGTTSTLEPIDDTACTYIGDGNLYGSSGVYNPQRFRLTTRDGQVFVLDRRSGLVSESDPHGNTLTIDAAGVHSTSGGSITFDRDSSGRITKVTGPAGETLIYAYSATGDLASVTDQKGAVTTFAYDAAHNLTGTSGPGGQPLMSAGYDASGRLTSITDATGKTVQIANDVAGQQEVFTDPTGETFIETLSDRGDVVAHAEVADGHANTYVYTYDSVGRQITSTDPIGNTNRQTYDSSGDLLTSTDAQGRKSTMTYGTHGELLTFTDPTGGVTTYTWDSSINLISVRDASGATTTYTYDSSGNRISERNALGAVRSYTYDTSGHVLTETDPVGRVTTQTYDVEGRLLTMTDGAGNRTTLSYDAAGLLTSSTDPTGAVTHYAHDALGRVTSVTDPLGRVTAYTYDGLGRVLSKTDPLGGRTNYTYDAAGRELTATDPTGAVLTYAYDGHGRAVALTDAVGRVTRRSYDDAGNLVSETNPGGGTTTYAYGPDGSRTSATDPLGRVTSVTYDGAGRLARQTDPLGNRTAYLYDPMGRLTSVTDPLGSTTSYAYDAAGHRIRATDPTGAVTTYAYDLAGQQTAVTDPSGRTTSSTYDAAGNLASTTDAAGHTTSYSYDAAGRQTRIVTALGRTTSSTYDAAGELRTVTDPIGNATVYTYDAGGRRVTATSARGGVTSTAYDADSRPARITDPLGGVVSISYDAAGQRTSITDPNGHVTTFTFAPLGGLASRTFPWGGAQSYTYDRAGQLTSESNARGTTATRVYDAGGNLVSVAVTGGNFSQTFDADHRRTSFTDPTGATSFTYDAAGRPTTVAAPAGTISYTYDAAGRHASETLPGGRSIAYTYDAAGLIASTTDWSGATVNFAHDADGQLTSITRPGSSTAISYDAAGRTASIAETNGGGAIDTFTYGYDADGNRTSMTSNAGTESYTTDLNDRLTGVRYTAGSTAAYTYDAAGNQTSSVAGGVTTNYTYDSSGRLVAAGAAPVANDADGNVVSRGGDTFAYDWANRLTSATVGGVANTYTYNADGDRVSATRGPSTSSFLLDLVGALPQVVGDGTNLYVRDPSGALLGWRNQTSGAATSPLVDGLGSVRYQTDATGSVTGTATYGAYGDVRSQTGTASPFGFTGEQADPTGLLYLRARYYDPSLGRFLSADTLDVSGPGSTGYNRFVYAQDDPTTGTDPSGHQLVDRALWTTVVEASVYLLFLIGIYIVWRLNYECVFNGRCLSPPALPSAGEGVIARPATYPTGQTRDKQAIKDATKAAAAACAAAGAFGAFTGINNPCNKLPINIFYIGPDLWEATWHDLNAISEHPFDWEILHKADDPRTTFDRTWYLKEPTCSGDAPKQHPGQDCDEYPFYKTEEGGPMGGDNLGADLRWIDSWQNRTQGSRLNGMYTRCRMVNGDTFLMFFATFTRGICKGK